jgi:hypothetical protein
MGFAVKKTSFVAQAPKAMPNAVDQRKAAPNPSWVIRFAV